MENSKICNYADDNTIWVKSKDIDPIVTNLNEELEILNNWFKENSMLLNEDKCKLMIVESKQNKRSDKAMITINNNPIVEVNEAKLLGITFDSHLTFDKHIKSICKSAGKKLSALSRLAPYLGSNKRILLMKTFVLSHFNYCPLVWMYCNRKSNNLINSIHERALRIAYNDQSSSFTELLQQDKSTTIHQLNIQKLLMEIYKTINGMNPTFMKEIFCTRESSHNLRTSHFELIRPNTNKYGTDTITFKGSSIWNSLPKDAKNCISVPSFQQTIDNNQEIRNLCNCRLCTEFIPNIGYVNVTHT